MSKLKTFKDEDEAMKHTIICPVLHCKMLPWRCAERKKRAQNMSWSNGDMSFDFSKCLKCERPERE